MSIELLPRLFQGAWMTIKVCSLSIVIGGLGGVLMGIFTSQRMKVPLLSGLFRGYVAVIRGTPLFIQLLLIYYALPELIMIDLSPFMAGVLALGLNSTAYISEILRGGINALPAGQWEASFCLGYTSFQTLFSIILPQTFRNVFPSLTNEFVSLIKESSILMILGLQELTKVSKDIVSRELNPFETYAATALIYFSMTNCLSLLSTRFEGGKS